MLKSGGAVRDIGLRYVWWATNVRDAVGVPALISWQWAEGRRLRGDSSP